MTDGTFSFLALGDSYTIGEGVVMRKNFPHRTVEILQGSGQRFYPPRILAKTGWTTGELIGAIALADLLPSYDFVSLLIGVNNEYRGRSLEEYEQEFEHLLYRAILLSGSRPDRVFVLSIPDWSVTPFAATYLPDAAGRNKEMIGREIDAFNGTAGRIARRQGTDFIDITEHSRLSTAEFVTDGLHPAAEEYHHWAGQLAGRMLGRI
jgi:hypothetical protein